MTDLDLAKIKEAADAHTIEPKRTCTCYPDADRPFPCPEKFAARDCYEAALIARLEAAEARNATAYAEGVEAAAKAVEAYKRDASFDDSQVGALEHNSNEENIVCAIRSLLKDKPNEKTRQIAPPGQSTGE